MMKHTYKLVGRLTISALLTFVLAAVMVVGTLAQETDNEYFQRVWDRTDRPVAEGAIQRTWMWGLPVTGQATEKYLESPEGERVVQYFDKSRMEITHPDADQEALWYVTNGLLVVEMMSGRVQIGDDEFVQTVTTEEPFSTGTALIPIAGDPDSGDITPSYGNMASPDVFAEGAVIDQRLVYHVDERYGDVWRPQHDASLADHGVTAVAVDTPTGHTVADVFWQFMNSSGTVWESGQFVTGTLFLNPFYATGYPVTEPFWGNTRIQGVEQEILMQCFERRCLTYTPGNPEGWQVEFGNVGQHYHTWRYEMVVDQLSGS